MGNRQVWMCRETMVTNHGVSGATMFDALHPYRRIIVIMIIIKILNMDLIKVTLFSVIIGCNSNNNNHINNIIII